MTLDLGTAAARFQNVATAELKRWFPDANNCIGAVRITTQVFQKLGFAARPLSVTYRCHNPAKKTVYISGTDPALKARARGNGAKVIDMRPGAMGWQGHVVAIVEECCWIDPTWMAAGEVVSVPRDVEPLVIFLPEGHDPLEKCEAQMHLTLDNGEKLELHYSASRDQGFKRAPAWELDHVDIAIETMRRKILGVMTPEADIEHFVIYRRPRDFPGATFVVRRHTLSWGEIFPKPDKEPWAVAAGENEDELLAMLRADFRAAGRYCLPRFKADDPCIVEVWI